MIFEKASDYLFEIFSNEENENALNLFFSSDDNISIGGLLKNKNEAYFLRKEPGSVGIRIDNDKYIFAQTRNKFINHPLFEILIRNDENESEEQLREKFKNVDFVEFFESDKEKNETVELSYLVNKSSYLLMKYKNSSKTNSVSATLSRVIFSDKNLQKLGLDNPSNDNFDIRKISQEVIVSVPYTQHIIFGMYSNGKELDNIELRSRFIKSLYSYIINADKNSYMIYNDSKDCIETIRKKLHKKYGIEGR